MSADDFQYFSNIFIRSTVDALGFYDIMHCEIAKKYLSVYIDVQSNETRWNDSRRRKKFKNLIDTTCSFIIYQANKTCFHRNSCRQDMQ